MSKRFDFTVAVIALLAVGAWGQQIQDPAVLTPILTTPNTDFQNPYQYTPPQPSFVPNPPWSANVLADSGSTSNPTDGALCVSGQRKVVVQWNHYVSSFVWRSANTTNAGTTWNPQTIDPTGTQYDNILGSNKKDSTMCLVMKGGGFYFKVSTNSGVTWGASTQVPPAAIGSGNDRPCMGVKYPYVLVTYFDNGATSFEGICRSTNWGTTWNASKVLLSNAQSQWGCPAFDPRPASNMAYAAWAQNLYGWTYGSWWFARSSNLGATWSTPSQIRTCDTAAFPRSRPNHNGPTIAVDNNGKIYLTSQNRLSGTGWDILVITSTNQGTTWSTAVQVNDTTGGGAQVLNAHSMLSWITIDRYNQPHVFWYDNRAYHPTRSFDVYYSYSTNGGVTWARNERINDVSPATTESAYLNMCGDYMQIDTDSSNVYVEWTDHRRGHTSNSYIATASRPLPIPSAVEDKPTGSPWVNHKFELAPSRPNPVMNGTELAFSLEQPAQASLRIYDLSGKLVRTLVTSFLAAGSHTARWDTRDESGKPVASGVYFYRLESGGLTATKQLVVTR